MTAGGGKGSGLQWFVRRGAAVRGPFSSTRVRHFVLEGKLGLDDEVSGDRHDWRRLGAVPEVVPLQMRADDAGLAVDKDVARKAERRGALRAIMVVSLLVVVLTVAVSLIGQEKTVDVRNCAAAPAPGILLDNCRLPAAKMRAASLAGARMANTVLNGADLSESDLTSANLRYSDLTGADVSYARLSDADLKGASLRLADLTNADLTGADLSFADLSAARIGGARLDGAVLNGAIWIDGRRCADGGCPR